MTYTCQKCGQATIEPRLVQATDRGGVYTVPARCDSCQQQDRRPQGEAMRLFAPAPTQITGQMTF